MEKPVDADRAALMEMVQKSGQTGVPVIELDGQIVVGFDRPRLERLLANSASRKASLGAAVADATKILVKRGQIPVFGAFVGKVSPGSPAQKAGLQPGDIITEINLRPISKADDVEVALASIRSGTTVQIVFLRDNKQVRTHVLF